MEHSLQMHEGNVPSSGGAKIDTLPVAGGAVPHLFASLRYWRFYGSFFECWHTIDQTMIKSRTHSLRSYLIPKQMSACTVIVTRHVKPPNSHGWVFSLLDHSFQITKWIMRAFHAMEEPLSWRHSFHLAQDCMHEERWSSLVVQRWPQRLSHGQIHHDNHRGLLNRNRVMYSAEHR